MKLWCGHIECGVMSDVHSQRAIVSQILHFVIVLLHNLQAGQNIL